MPATREVRELKAREPQRETTAALRKKPYYRTSARPRNSSSYRRNRTNGTWVVKASNGRGGYWTEGFAVADDFEEPDRHPRPNVPPGRRRRQGVARGKADIADSKPMTVADALGPRMQN